MSESVNPYQAPESQEHGDATLADDAEFLISGGEILCRETVELPKICIGSGLTTNLTKREKTHYATLYPMALPIIAVLVLPMVIFAGGIPFMVFMLVVVGALFLPQLARLEVPGFIRVSVTWYVAHEYLQRCRRYQWIIRGFIAAAMTALGFTLAMFESPQDPGHTTRAVLIGLAVGTTCGVISLAFKLERQMQCSGRRWRGIHKGLFSLRGHSKKFSDAVERVIHSGF